MWCQNTIPGVLEAAQTASSLFSSIHIALRLVGRVAQSVQRLATGWTVRESNPGGGEIFRTCPDRPWGPPSILYNGYRVFPGGKKRPGHDADPSPPSSAVVMKGQSYTSAPPMGRTACTEPQCLYRGALYLYLKVWQASVEKLPRTMPRLMVLLFLELVKPSTFTEYTHRNTSTSSLDES